MTYLETAPHEFGANFQFVDHGIEPFVALNKLVTAAGGSCSARFEFERETWSATLEPRGSGLRDPGYRLPTGTPFPVDELREFGLRIESEQDPVGKRSAYVHVRPRWQGMESEQGHDPSIPRSIEEGVNMKVDGSNIEYCHYLPLIRGAVTALGLTGGYFETIHETSTVYQAERYVRVRKDCQGPLLSRDGPLKQIQQVVLNDREGGERVDWVDTDGHGRKAPGHYVTLPLGRSSNAELFPDHTYSMVIKFYQSREALTLDAEEALAHPKLCARYRRGRRNEKVSATLEGLAELKQEQDEKLLTLLKTAGLPLRHEFGSYIKDAYFEPTATDRDLAVAELDLDQVRDTQHALVMRYFADSPSPVEREALEVLVKNGDGIGPQDIAEQTGRHVGSVYRALRRIPGLVERSYGEVALRSREIASLIHESLERAGERLRTAPCEGADETERAREDKEAALFRWMERYGIELSVRETDGSLVVDLGPETYHIDEVHRLVRQGRNLWTQAGRAVEDYRTATLRFKREAGGGSNYLPELNPEVSVGKVWQYLA